jgi:hypothetical protein
MTGDVVAKIEGLPLVASNHLKITFLSFFVQPGINISRQLKESFGEEKEKFVLINYTLTICRTV